MASTQKQKLLYIAQFLMERTDEDHYVTTGEIIEYLERNGVKAERKSIYDDVDTLMDFGMDIVKVGGKTGGYQLASRDFELAELKLLVDLVQSSKFITTKKSRELIGKLEKLASNQDAKQLQRQVVVTDRNKTVNESIYYNVDLIYKAMAANVQVKFQYFEWDTRKQMRLRKDGAFYQISPWLLTWDDENYYLMGYDAEAEMLKHYRVDKMLKIQLVQENREGRMAFEKVDVAAFSKKTFGMFAGEEKTVNLKCSNTLTGVMVDRFGKDVPIRKFDETHILVRVNVAVSTQFFGWVAGLGNKVKIQSPDSVVTEYQNFLKEILAVYSD